MNVTGLRDPMAWVAMGLAAAVLLAGLILTATFDVPAVGSQGPGGQPSAGGGGEPPEGQATPPSVPIPVAAAAATGEAPPVDRGGGLQDTYTAANAVDADDATAWCVPGDGIGHSLQLDLGRSVPVTEIAMIPGYAKIDPDTGDDRFVENRKIRRVRFLFDDGSSHRRAFRPPTRDLIATTLPQPVSTGRITIEILATTEPALPNRDYTCISTVTIRGLG